MDELPALPDLTDLTLFGPLLLDFFFLSAFNGSDRSMAAGLDGAEDDLLCLPMMFVVCRTVYMSIVTLS